LNAESTGATNRRFTSYDRSNTTGLDYANNRHYDSQQGRFTQVDPAGMGAASLTSPQTLNLYAYCTNDPINHTDPNGLGFFSFLKKVFKGILKVLQNRWVQIAIIVAIILIAHFYPNSIFGSLGGATTSHAASAPVLHAAGAATAAGSGAASGVLVGTITEALEGVITLSMGVDLASLGLAGALGAGIGAQLAQHADPTKSQDNKASGGKTGPCPGFAKKFFDSTLDVLRSLASSLSVNPLLIITHASFESGWLDAHNRALNNLFGYTHAGGRNQRFSSLQAAADTYAKHTGPVVQGSQTADEFLGKLGEAHYNADMTEYGKRFKARLGDVKKFGNGCGVLAP
jgi:RHS repeat-associated protein